MTAQAATQAAAPQVLPQDRAGFGVYLHWPFCRSKCPYCDFNSHVRESFDQARWRAALLSDLEHAAAKSGTRRVSSVLFAGGTPPLMPAEPTAPALATTTHLWGMPAAP